MGDALAGQCGPEMASHPTRIGATARKHHLLFISRGAREGEQSEREATGQGKGMAGSLSRNAALRRYPGGLSSCCWACLVLAEEGHFLCSPLVAETSWSEFLSLCSTGSCHVPRTAQPHLGCPPHGCRKCPCRPSAAWCRSSSSPLSPAPCRVFLSKG